jgi:hypothetical protein
VSEETKKPNDDGPAFVGEGWAIDDMRVVQGGGLTVRDWFAGQALAGMQANQQLMSSLAAKCGRDDALFSELSDAAYGMADAMLAERAKGVQP